MIKTILAFLIIGAWVAWTMYAMAQYPVLMWIGIFVGSVVAFTWVCAWAIQHIGSKFSSKNSAE